jgi:spore coat polysaccharide biosynthesis protein SpsF (cytidylyltransferase family)
MDQTLSFIIQARAKSTRLPNKVLLPFYHANTILDIIVKRLSAHFSGIPIILATTTNPADDIIETKYKKNNSIQVFRGNEKNVLKRFIDAAEKYKTEQIVRICSDNPFLSMTYLQTMIEGHSKTLPDYTSFQFKDGNPAIKSHSGLFAEMVSLHALRKVANITLDPLYCEHVTNYIYSHPSSFKINFIPVPDILNSYIDKLRLTIDTKEDFENLQKLYLSVLSKYGKNYTTEQLLTEIQSDMKLIAAMQEQILQHAK